MVSKKRVGIALCGLGRMGQIHAKNILQHNRADFLYIVEVDLTKAKQFIEENHLEEITTVVHYENFKETLNTDSRLNAVIVATPTHAHGGFVKLALNAGKHVLCEKPLAVNLEDTMTCYKLAKSKGLALLCAFNRRFDPQIQNIIKNKDKVGKILTIRVCSRDAPRPSIDYLKISGGIFHDCLVHDMDLGRLLVGENPETVYVAVRPLYTKPITGWKPERCKRIDCLCHKQYLEQALENRIHEAHCHDPEIAALGDVDTVLTTLKFPSGTLMNIESQRDCVFGYDQTVEIYGTKGNMIGGNPRKSAITLNGGMKADDIHDSFNGRYADSYRQELEHFIDLALGKVATPLVTEVDTLQATLLCQAAEDSCKGKKIIDFKSHSKEILSRRWLEDWK